MTLSGTKDTTFFVCGPNNPLGLQVPFEPDSHAGSATTYLAQGAQRLERNPARRSNHFDTGVDNTEGSLPAESSTVLYPVAQPAIRRQQKSVEAYEQHRSGL